VVGHSLGSVISYDVLNLLLLEDEKNAALRRPTSPPGPAPRKPGEPADPLNIQERTKFLLTFGSPLDKAAFLFRTKGGTDELREAAAAAWQPLIQDYGFRPAEWVNIYSWMDIISARLQYYDDPDNPANGGGQRVHNRYDWEAILPLAAHTSYWTDKIFGDTIYNRIIR
jgi:hypothetical protein